jgi:hypothetical protein
MVLSKADELLYKKYLASEKTADEAMWMFQRDKCLNDLFYLGYEVLEWKNAKKGERRRIDPAFHRWLAAKMQDSDDKMILVPRGHLKTAWMKLLIVQNILRDPMARNAYCAASATLAEAVLRDIKVILASPILIRLFPEVLREPGKNYSNWDKCTQDLLTVYRPGNEPSHGEQVTVFGVGASITGLHFDHFFLDDLVDPKNVNTQDQMKKIEEFWSYLQPIIDDGDTTILGTFYHYNDLYNKIIRERQFPRNKIFIRRAVENGKVLYSSWHSKKTLAKIKRKMTRYTWNCQYMLNPVTKEDQIFPPPHPTFSGKLPPGKYRYYIAIDPAATKEDYSDETGIVIAAVNEVNQIWILEAHGYKGEANKMVEFIFAKCVQYNPTRVGIELGQQAHLATLIDVMKREYEIAHKCTVPYNLFKIPVSRAMSKEVRIRRTLGAFIREGKVFIHDSCTDLMREMDHFTGKGKEKDNRVDAASMIMACMEGMAYNYWVRKSYSGGGHSFYDIFSKKKTYEWRKEFEHAAV